MHGKKKRPRLDKADLYRYPPHAWKEEKAIKGKAINCIPDVWFVQLPSPCMDRKRCRDWIISDVIPMLDLYSFPPHAWAEEEAIINWIISDVIPMLDCTASSPHAREDINCIPDVWFVQRPSPCMGKRRGRDWIISDVIPEAWFV